MKIQRMEYNTTGQFVAIWYLDENGKEERELFLDPASPVWKQKPIENKNSQMIRETCEHLVRKYGTDEKGLMNLYRLLNPHISNPQEYRDALRRIKGEKP